MTKIEIEKATPAQLDYAAAIAQGWQIKTPSKNYIVWMYAKKVICKVELYHPTSNDDQLGKLIDEFFIDSIFDDDMNVWSSCALSGSQYVFAESRKIAAVKAFLWSKNPDGMIEVCNEKTI